MLPPTILITGGAGYIGSRLLQSLTRRSGTSPVRVLDNLQDGGYRALMDLGSSGVEFLEGDILDPSTVRRSLDGVDVVVHLAAVVSTPLSFQHTRWTEQVNHWGTVQLVEACLHARVERFVFVSSYSVYGPGQEGDERSLCKPMGPYASSKLAAEKAVRIAADRGLSPTVLRMGTVFGDAPVIRFDALPNRFAYLAGTGRTITVYGDGRQTRPLTHVADAASALSFCLERPEETAGGTFNVLTTNASVLDVVEVVKRVRPEAKVRFTEQDVRTHLSFLMKGDRFHDLGWKSLHSLEEGVAAVAERFRGVTLARGNTDEGLEVAGMEPGEWLDI